MAFDLIASIIGRTAELSKVIDKPEPMNKRARRLNANKIHSLFREL
jgi:hypothetical protein